MKHAQFFLISGKLCPERQKLLDLLNLAAIWRTAKVVFQEVWKSRADILSIPLGESGLYVRCDSTEMLRVLFFCSCNLIEIVI